VNALAEQIITAVARVRSRKSGLPVAEEVAGAVRDALAFQASHGREFITSNSCRRPDEAAKDIEKCFRVSRPVAYALVGRLGWFTPAAPPRAMRPRTQADLVRELRALVIDAAVELTRLDPAAAERFSAAARPVLGEEALRG